MLIALYPVPSTGISTLGTAAMSVCLSLLFLRTDSVWLTAGIRMGVHLLSFGLGSSLPPRTFPADAGLAIVFGVPAVIMLLLEINKLQSFRRPGGGSRRGPQRVVYGRTVRGPWGPH
jgi:hypothetical protein